MTITALVKLLRAPGTLEDVKKYVKENPGSVREKDEETGRIALHDAVDATVLEENHDRVTVVGLEKITLLLQSYPEGITEKDKQGRLPLHVAAASLIDAPQCLRTLVNEYGAATKIFDSEGYLPVHCAISAQNFGTAAYLIENQTGAVVGTEMEEAPPLLDMAIRYDAPYDFIQLLLERVPGCAEEVGRRRPFTPSYCFVVWGFSTKGGASSKRKPECAAKGRCQRISAHSPRGPL